MDTTAWMLLLGSGLVSFLVGTLLRRAWQRRRHQKAQELLLQMQELARQRQAGAAPALNKSKRRRQQRDQARDAAGRS